MREIVGDQLVERDYARVSLKAEEVEQIFGDAPLADFLNTRHAIYKERGFAKHLPPHDELINLIIKEPNLLRRPITRRGNRVAIGFDREALKKISEE